MQIVHVVRAGVVFAALGSATVRAGSIQIFDAVNSGSFTSLGQRVMSSKPPGEAYIAGYQGAAVVSGKEYRGFVLFDLSALTIPAGEIVAKVTLVLDTQLYDSPHEGELLNFYDVTSSVDQLNNANPSTGGEAVFDDLGGGLRYGGHLYRPSEAFEVLSLPLFQETREAVEDAQGDAFAIGFRMATIDPAEHQLFRFDEFLFAGGRQGPKARLEVLVAAPEPRTSAFAITALVALSVFHRAA